MKKLLFIMLGILLLSLLLVSACAGTTSTGSTSSTSKPAASQSTATPQYGGRLRIIIGSGPGGVIGWPPETVGAASVYTKCCVESLLFEDTNGNIKQWLATDWKIASDQKSITFTLRKGVKFHDGSDFNAQVVKFNLDATKAAKKAGTDIWASVDVIDDYTVRLNLSQYQSTVLNNLAESDGAMVSQVAYQTHGLDWVRANPVGTGSFKFNSFTQDVALKYDRNENYWQKGKPYLDGLDYIIVKDSSTALASFENGEADMMSVGTPKSANDLKNLGYPLIYTPTNTVCLIPDSNDADSPFADLKVRQAVEYSLNKEQMAQTLGYGFWLPAYEYAVPTQSIYVKDITQRKYDINQAKQLLTQAGYPTGFKATIIPDPSSSNPDATTYIQSAFKDIGIDATINNAGAAAFTNYRTNGWNNGLINMAIGVMVPNAAGGMASNFAADIFPA